jgi:hypothetical protein
VRPEFGSRIVRKFKDEQDMVSAKIAERRIKEIEDLAKGWGKLVAREAYPNGPELDVSLADMEDIAAAASRALVAGVVETLAGDQSEKLGKEHPCPTCGKHCELEQKPRPITVRGGTATLDEPVAHCSACRRDFFPSASSVEG